MHVAVATSFLVFLGLTSTAYPLLLLLRRRASQKVFDSFIEGIEFSPLIESYKKAFKNPVPWSSIFISALIAVLYWLALYVVMTYG